MEKLQLLVLKEQTSTLDSSGTLLNLILLFLGKKLKFLVVGALHGN